MENEIAKTSYFFSFISFLHQVNIVSHFGYKFMLIFTTLTISHGITITTLSYFPSYPKRIWDDGFSIYRHLLLLPFYIFLKSCGGYKWSYNFIEYLVGVICVSQHSMKQCRPPPSSVFVTLYHKLLIYPWTICYQKANMLS